jgi:hypothetical protein
MIGYLACAEHTATGVAAACLPDNAHRDSPDEVFVSRNDTAPTTHEQPAHELATRQHPEQHMYGRNKRSGGAHCVSAGQTRSLQDGWRLRNAQM